MKGVFSFVNRITLLIVFVLLLSGCKQNPSATLVTDLQTKPSLAPSDPALLPIKTIYIPVSETWTYMDGVQSGLVITVEYIYDSENRLQQIKQGSEYYDYVCEVTSDEYGRALLVEHHNGFRQAFTYDEYGRVQTFDVFGSVREYTYDEEGKLIRSTLPYGQGSEVGSYITEYLYRDGLLVEKNEYQEETVRTYQGGSWIETKECTQLGSTVYEYDSYGRIIRETTNSPGCELLVASYSYSDDGLTRTRVCNGTTNIEIFDDNGNLISVEYSSAISTYKCEYTYKAIEVPSESQYNPYQESEPH